jgi:signal transduction histidine kinase
MKLRRPSLTVVLVVALMALVPLLAVLQYRWVGQVSRAERERMRTSLDSAVKNFTEEFDRELVRIYLDLQLDLPSMGGDSTPPPDWRARAVRNYGSRYKRWLAQATHPQLVKEIMLIEPKKQPARFNVSTSAFVDTDWPAALQPYRSRFEQQSDSRDFGHSPFRVQRIETVLDDVPALVIPVPDIKLIGEGSKLKVITPDLAFPGFIVVLLDADFISRSFLPELAARYFKSSGEFNYNVAVVKGDNSSDVIYQTDPSSPTQTVDTADASASLFRLRLEMPGLFEAFTNEVTSNPDSKKKAAILKNEIAVQYINRGSGSLPPPKTADRDKSVNTRIAFVSGEGSHWRVLATHKVGSLDAAVASVRNRNLIVSFSILLVLSLTVGLIVLTARRASRLARQQVEFVAGISHELRTPLAVIRSAAENLADGVIEDRSQVKRYGELIGNEGRRLSAMVEQTLEFAGIQSGKRSYTLQSTSVRDVIADALSACRPLLDENGFQVETRIAPVLPPISADREALARAFQNLIINAVKYSGDQRWIGISAREGRDSTPFAVLIEVQDKGLGINSSEIRQIFEPFYRGKDVLAAQIHGNGLGLSLVRDVVKSHGGVVQVESHPGRGSVFSIRLPAIADEPRVIEVAASQSAGVPQQADS